jgi:hypothetical protein
MLDFLAPLRGGEGHGRPGGAGPGVMPLHVGVMALHVGSGSTNANYIGLELTHDGSVTP